MKNTIIKKLIFWLALAGICSVGIFLMLMHYNKKARTIATSELGSLYMSEMMFQMQDHFESIVEVKHNEAEHIAEHAVSTPNYREALCKAAECMNFEYLALYDRAGNCETILGQTAWYRNLGGFISKVLAGENTVTTGYLTSTGGKYIVFGVPAQYEMGSGETSEVMLVGFNVEKLYEYINMDEMGQLVRNTDVWIIATNGSYVLKSSEIKENSFYNYISNYGSFVGKSIEEGIKLIETAMACRESFSGMVSLDGVLQHVYGAPAKAPGDWYFVISMPQGITDKVISVQNQKVLHSFALAGTVILLLLLGVFTLYFRLSVQQIRETEKAWQEAETANKAKSVFLSNMSHDIRTPMNAIVGLAPILEENVKAGNQQKTLDALEKIKRSSDYLLSLISDVLDMSKIESGMLTLIPESMSLKEIVNTVEVIANARASAGQQTFEVNVHDIIHDRVYCDYARLNQILINLLGNAMKFTPEGGRITFEIWQELSEKGSEFVKTCFIVEDNGVGMSPQFLKVMFDSFTREDSRVRKIEGTGLGLAITKNLLDMMDGTITAESTEGVGSKFYVTIDLERAACEGQEGTDFSEPFMESGLRVLLAEDNDLNADIAQVLLSSNGFVSERAENGRIAVEKYCNNHDKWDLILMDLRMPELDGYQAAEKIREFEAGLPNKVHIPIFALSADVFEEDIKRCYAVGMEGHISKPINIKEMLHTLQKHMVVKNNK